MRGNSHIRNVSRGKIILASAGLILIGFMIVLVRTPASSTSALLPPVLSFYPAELGGVIDDSPEMILAALSLKNTNNFRLYINSSKAVEARVSNHWVKVECKLKWTLDPQMCGIKMILIPQHADSCRVSLKYTGASLSISAKLDTFLQTKLGGKKVLPPRLLAWVQSHDTYSPKPPWQEIKLEADMPLAAQPAK